MKAAKLYGAKDFRIEDVKNPRPLQPGEALLKITVVGVCGSDLHTYEDGRIGDTVVENPVIMGHEFAGTVIAVGENAHDGQHQPLVVGQRVAVEPATPCWHCDKCEAGHPNLCRNLGFLGLSPNDGALQEQLIVPARNCFPIPDSMTMDEAVLLEPLGIGIHAVDLGKLKVGRSVAVLGCGPIGLLTLRMAKLSGAAPIYAFDQFGWRLDLAKKWGADRVINIKDGDPVAALKQATDGRGVDVVFEAAWADESVNQAMEMADLGGRVVMIGIPGDNQVNFLHSTARRKGLTIMMCRRMKHTYPRAIELSQAGLVDLPALVTHRFSLEDAGKAFAANIAYKDGIIKAMIDLDDGK